MKNKAIVLLWWNVNCFLANTLDLLNKPCIYHILTIDENKERKKERKKELRKKQTNMGVKPKK